MRPGERRIREMSTPYFRRSATAASAKGFCCGRIVKKVAGSLKCASDTATLSSPPPKVAFRIRDCKRRSYPRRLLTLAQLRQVLPRRACKLSGNDDKAALRPYRAKETRQTARPPESRCGLFRNPKRYLRRSKPDWEGIAS